MNPVTAIVPAAGLSRRFGGPNKLLQPWGDTTIVGAVIRTLLSCNLPVVVVTGRDADEVAEYCGGASIAHNPRYEEGLGLSIAVGAYRVPEGHGVLITLGDMPDLRPEVVRTIVGNLQKPTDILAPVYLDEPDRPGHPVLFGTSYREVLTSLRGDEGAKAVMQENRSHLKLIQVEGNLTDIDTP